MSSFSILITYFCKNYINLECSSLFFIYSLSRGFIFSYYYASFFNYNYLNFSDNMWLLCFDSNLNLLNSSIAVIIKVSCSFNLFYILFCMFTIYTYFYKNFTIKFPYIVDFLSNNVIVWLFIVSSKIMYFI